MQCEKYEYFFILENSLKINNFARIRKIKLCKKHFDIKDSRAGEKPKFC